MVASLICGESVLSSDRLNERALRAVSALDRLGLRDGDVVAVMLRNDLACFEMLLAARLGGFLACPINWHYKQAETAHILRDSGARALVIHADLLGQIGAAVPANVTVVAVSPSAAVRVAFAIADTDCATPPHILDYEDWLAASPTYAGPPRRPRTTLPYSSGTTGKPKGIRREPLTAEQAERITEITRIAFGTEVGSRTAAVAPLYHSAPTLHAVQSMLRGEVIVIHPRFDAERLLADIERHRLTSLYLVPTLLVRLLRLPEEVKRRYDLASLEFVGMTGSPCPPEVKRAMVEWWGPIITETYASSEAGLVTFCAAEDALERPGTAGRALPWASLRIMNEGRELPPGEIGLIYTRHEAYPAFTYVNNEAARQEIEHDGFITVGDMGYLDADGYLFVCDRRSDMVISGGVNIYPAEIEAELIKLPGVVDCAVFGIPDAEFGEALAAHIQVDGRTHLQGEEVRSFLAERLASYKVPRVVEFTDQLPREETGKVFKRQLREPYWQGSGRRI
jgi:long-chain acyl-CoA synthetase